MAALLAASLPTFLAAPPAIAQVADQSPVLFVLNARNATLAGNKLTLEGVSPSAVVFATRPSRSVLHVATPDMVELWKSGTFAKNPPNAAISVFEKDGSGISDAVVVLGRANLAGDTLVFDVAVVNGSISGADGPASMFIDTIWFQGGEYIGKSKTSGGSAPAVGSRSDTSTLKGWSNPAPTGTQRGSSQQGGATARPPPSAAPARTTPCGPPHFPPC
ncbi:MAG: hypothetical protein ACT4O6_05020 [Reyranella sp.]